MPAITNEVLGNAVIAVRKMDLHQRERLADEIHARQPNLLYAVLSVRSFGASYEQLEVVLNILFACFQSMKLSGRRFRVIDETYRSAAWSD
jgi:hypothetical protein